ncbi:protocadherin-16-like [Heterodontus francisci]|uniref:protocadherin-16-like n=1 Tax=Heterodontus francisci TaxID=7792 RepID=UPI00355BCE33
MDLMRRSQAKCRGMFLWLHVVLGFLIGRCMAESDEPLILQIDEEQPPYTIIGDINAGLPPGHITSSFFIHETDGTGMSSDLIIDETTGIIKTARVLDHESRDKYKFVAVNWGGDAVEVVIIVNDINDNAPVFPNSQMRLNVPEQTPVGTRFRLDSAIDADGGQFNTQGYLIKDGNVGQAFRLETKRVAETLDLELVVNNPLDRENKATYTLVIEAFDGGAPRRTSQMTLDVSILDVNDNAPIFNQTRYYTMISESLQPGSSLLQVFATDVDEGNNGVVIYEINRRQSDPNQYFVIDSKTGVIKLNKGLDYEMKKVHELVVQARDNATHPEVTTAFVTVQVKDYNDNQPTLTIIFLSEDGSPHISEGAQPGQFVARISVSDPDYGEYAKVNVSLDGGDGKFGLTTKDNIIYLICVDQVLDREEQDTYQLSVTATDSGTPPLRAESTFTIHVTDVNDNPPVFDHSGYRQSIPEVLYPGSFVLQVTARDKDEGSNGEIVYSIISSPKSHSDWFTIDQATGVITTAATLDYEMDPAPRLMVVATDRGNTPMSSSVTVTILIQDVNDNEPVFSSNFYNTSIKENEQTGTCFLQVSATDADSGSFGTITYSIGSGIGNLAPTQFTIDQHTGNVCTTKTLDRDEGPNHYEFTVTAVDGGGLKSMAYVKVYLDDINDNRPVFYPVHYAASLSTQSLPGTAVLRVSAFDKDGGRNGKVTYRIMSGNLLHLFKLNRDTGVLSLATHLHGRADTVQRLVISAQDAGGLTSLVNAMVNISIVSGTISPPLFEQAQYFFTIPEDVRRGSHIGSVRALNSPGHSDSVFYTISAGDPNGYFAIGMSSGLIRTSIPLDHESHPVVILDIQACSGSPPAYSSTKVKITISDINDNTPTFPTSSESILVPENTEIGSLIYTVNAEDRDSGANGQVQFDIISNAERTFSIDRTSGKLRVIGSLSYEMVPRYDLKIVAKDSGAPQLSSTFTLVIHIQDESDNAPIFDTLTYRVEVKEGTPVNTRFLQVRALSQDSKDIHITYHLRSDGDSTNFGIVPESGWLYVKSALDRENKDLFSLTVVASTREGEQRKTGTTTVRVCVTDENDNAPKLSEDRYFFTVQENILPGSTIGRILATDRDHGLNSKLTYRLFPAHSSFLINSLTGEISSKVTFDRESQASHQVTVVVQDGGSPPRSVTGNVYVMVLDENDNAPVFTNAPVGNELVVQVFEGNPSENLVATLQAKDPDEGENGTVVYSLSGSWAQQFSLHPTSGELRTAAVLRRPERHEYELTVLASDRGHPSQTTSLAVRVQVLSSHSNLPQSGSSTVTFKSIEGMAPGSVIGSVASQDLLTRADGQLTYTVVGGTDVDGRFVVDRVTGNIYLAQELDYELGSHYQLEIAIDDLSTGFPHSTVTIVEIDIEDRNEYAPQFPEDPITVVISENAEIGASVYTFQAVDKDGSGPNSEVRYSVLQQTPPGTFLWIDPITGVLTAGATIDRELTPFFLLVVQATDQAVNNSQRRSSAVTVRVFVTDENDNSPHFLSPPVLNVMEDQPVGTIVSYVVAQDADLGENGRVSYRIKSGLGGSKFLLNPNTGALSIVKRLDCEEQSWFNLTVEASDHGTFQHSAIQLLHIQVIDVNDDVPRFDETAYEASVMENQSAGMLVIQLHATDRDQGSNGRLRYGGVVENSFSIDPVTGVIRTSHVLDREEQDHHVITVYTKDGGSPPNFATVTVSITVKDENDNRPMFEKDVYELQVPENQEHVSLFMAKATDKDSGENGRVEYEIIEGDPNGHFRIDRNTGVLSTNSGLDRESISLYALTILARDQGIPQHSSSVSVSVTVLDINDNSPTFKESFYTIDIPEDSAVGSVVLEVSAADGDEGSNGDVLYYLSRESVGMFHIDEMGKISTVMSLDREKQSTYTFLVRAVDSAPSDPRSSSIQVEVNVKDINDNSPHFIIDPLIANISKHTPVNQVVATMKADDKDFGANASIFYRFSTVVSGFSINSFTGEIRLLTSVTSMSQSERTLFVVATDQGSPSRSSTGVVMIYLREEKYRGIRFWRSVSEVPLAENSAPGTPVVKIQAQHPDGSHRGILYSIFSGNEKGAFTIRSNTGDISVKSSSGLDFEQTPKLRLVVRAEFSSSFIFTAVTLSLQDVNDNLPHFQLQNYVAFIWEAQGYSTPIMQVLANDLDQGQNGQVTYSIAASSQSDLFQINPLTGDISTAAIMDREIWPQTQLLLTATDRGMPRLVGTATLTVIVLDLNDNSPTIPLPHVVRVPENALIGSEITKVTGNDVDSGPVLSYTLVTESEKFSINRYHGIISLTGSLDFEERSWYLLTVQSSDSKHGTKANLTIVVEDVNDNPPVFVQDLYQVTLSEFAARGSTVITVTATDRDSGENGQILYRLMSPSSGPFSIDPHNGTLFTVREVELGVSEPLDLVIEARDRGSPALSSYTTVQIQVLDINDHSPSFSHGGYAAQVLEDLSPGSTILTFEAIDIDSSRDNSGLDYTIVSGNIANVFQMESRVQVVDGHLKTLGSIVLLDALDFETVPIYNLTISASDRGVPQRSAIVSAIITIQDVNDNAPVFNRTQYKVTVSESVAEGAEIVRVAAHDVDSGPNSALRYTITSGNENGQFEVSEMTGIVRLVKSLDRETRDRHIFIIQVTDSQGPRTNFALVPLAVEVKDVNDNHPFFPMETLSTNIRENLPAHSLVTKVHAIDFDCGIFGELQYSIISQPVSQPGLAKDKDIFYINQSTGALRTKVSFDFEKLNTFQVVVKAVDSGNSSATVTVQVLVTGEDEYDPVFVSPTYNFAVSENAKKGQSIGQVMATDEDGGLDGIVLYSLLTPSQYFELNKTTGDIILKMDSQRHQSKRSKRETRTMTLNIQAKSPLAISRSSITQASIDITQTSFGLAPEVNLLLIVALAASLGIGGILAIIGLALVIVRARRKKNHEETCSQLNNIQDNTLQKLGADDATLPASDRIYHQTLPGYSAEPTVVGGPYSRGDSIDPSHSSGRGSAEAAEDDEIRMINEYPRVSSISSSMQEHVSTRGPDSGIQQDADQMSDISTDPGMEWFKHKKSSSLLMPMQQQVYRDDGGGYMGMGLGLGVCQAKDYVFAEDGRPSAQGSLTAIVASDEELRGSYNWDYLLNWCPQFQPLASVFTEIARLKDESAPRKHFQSKPKVDPKPRIDPPPLITSVAHPNAMSVPPRLAVGRTHSHVTAMPRSPITSDASIASSAMSPSFSPSLSPLAARSPAVSPFDVSQGPSTSIISTEHSLDNPEEPELRI